MTSALSKSSVLVCSHVRAKTAFSRSSVFIDRFQQIRVDGSRIRKEKVAFSNENGYVWTGPQSVFLVRDKQMRFIVQYTEF